MKLLETTEQSHELEKIITDSQDFLIIVSPYLQISKRLKPKLEECFKRNKRSLIIYRENRLTSNEMDWFDKFPNLQYLPVQHLHAKCYINEKAALLTSMNWYEHSQINNHEIGIKFEAEKNSEEISTLHNFVNTILRTDHPSRNLKEFTEHKSEYTMGRLYADLTDCYQFVPMKGGLNAVYQKMCDEARKHLKFKPADYKKESDTLLRNTIISFQVYEDVKNYMVENWVAKPGELIEEYDWHTFHQEWQKYLSHSYPGADFKMEEDIIVTKDFPVKNVDFSTRYGFASFVINYGYDYMDSVKDQKQYKLYTAFNNYRLYWSPSHKINIYHAKNINFKNVNEDIKYCANALNNIIDEIRRFK